MVELAKASRVAGNAVGSNVKEIEYNPHRAQLRFRDAIINHLDAYLGPVIDLFLSQALRSIAGERSAVYLEYNFEIVPRQNTHARPVDEGAPLPDPPVHYADATETLRIDEPNGHRGPLFERMFVLDPAPSINMVFAAESAGGAAGPVHDLIPGPSSEERAVYFIELLAEIQHHINRVTR
ncbi:hypothetical protein BBP40_007880 [Aspergillus hancockii]|nr:hypothetical protein BBP40_007880 [Aspergillus hancockii]